MANKMENRKNYNRCTDNRRSNKKFKKLGIDVPDKEISIASFG